MTLPDTIFKIDKRGRERILEQGEPDVAVSAAVKRTILRLLEAGATQTEICSSAGMPSRNIVWEARKDDLAFDTDFRAAQAKGAETNIDLAKAHALDEIETRDPDRVRCAVMMMDIAVKYAEKIAPREFGQLVKLAGDPNAPLQLNVVSYALPVSAALVQVDCTNDGTIARADEIQIGHATGEESSQGQGIRDTEGNAREDS
jgi:hypothetical protein